MKLQEKGFQGGQLESKVLRCSGRKCFINIAKG